MQNFDCDFGPLPKRSVREADPYIPFVQVQRELLNRFVVVMIGSSVIVAKSHRFKSETHLAES